MQNGVTPRMGRVSRNDSYVDRFFDKNVTEFLISEGKAMFTIINDELAILAIGSQKINFWND